MKKLISLFAAISMLSISAVAVQAEGMANYLPTSDAYSFEYTGLTAGEYYGMVAVEGVGEEINTLDVAKFVYIDQATADSTGAISFSGFAPKGVTPSDANYKESTVFIGGAGLNGAQAIGILRPTGWEENTSTDIIISGKAIDTVSSIKLAKIVVMNAAGDVVNTAEATADGVYAITVPAGTNYSVVITKDGYLTFTYTNVAAEADITLADVTISNFSGDIDSNGEIKINDLLALLADYDKAADDADNEYSDVDGNSEIKINDLLALLASYDRANVTAEAAYVTAE